jgi:hypothetical protein
MDRHIENALAELRKSNRIASESSQSGRAGR